MIPAAVASLNLRKNLNIYKPLIWLVGTIVQKFGLENTNALLYLCDVMETVT